MRTLCGLDKTHLLWYNNNVIDFCAPSNRTPHGQNRVAHVVRIVCCQYGYALLFLLWANTDYF